MFGEKDDLKMSTEYVTHDTESKSHHHILLKQMMFNRSKTLKLYFINYSEIVC